MNFVPTKELIDTQKRIRKMYMKEADYYTNVALPLVAQLKEEQNTGKETSTTFFGMVGEVIPSVLLGYILGTITVYALIGWFIVRPALKYIGALLH